jgi:hypothetical protein
MGRPRQRCTGLPGAGPGRGAPPGPTASPRAREPIFSKRHTDEFCGIGKSSQEPAGPCGPLHPGRWVYEKGAGRAAAGLGANSIGVILGGSWAAGGALAGSRLKRVLRGALVRCCELASPFLANAIQMNFAGLGNPPKSQLGRAGHCTPAGGYMRKEQDKLLWGGCRGTALAPLHGSLRRPLLVPFHTSPLSRGALRSAGVPTIAASTTPAPRLPWLSAGAARHLGRLCRRKGIPRVRRGVGSVGAWRFARPH